MSSTNEFDIVICGGGLVGASLAVALDSSNLKVALIESAILGNSQQPSFDSRMLALTFSAKKILSSWDIWDQLPFRQVSPINDIFVTEQGSRVKATMSATDIGCEALGWNVEANAIGKSLYQRLNGRANVEVITPAKAHNINVSRDTATVTVSIGKSVRRISANLAVIADGGRSELCGQLGFELEQRRYRQNALVCQLDMDEKHFGRAYEIFTLHGPIALLPIRDRSYALVWTHRAAASNDLLGYSEQEFIQKLEQELGEKSPRFVKLINKRVVYPLYRSWLKCAVSERAVAVGNAAHVVHPVAGQGLNLGLREIAMLAEELIKYRNRGWDVGSLTVLQNYERRRQSEGRSVVLFTHGLVRIFADSRPWMRLARRIGIFAISNYSPSRRFLLRRTTGLRSLQNTSSKKR